MLETLARRIPAETLALESAPAYFLAPDGKQAPGEATVTVTRSTITIRFTPNDPLVVAKAAYGESNGDVCALDRSWHAHDVNHAGTAGNSTDHLFSTMALSIGRHDGRHVAATRLVIAGSAWQGTGTLGGRRVVAHPLSRDVVSHHDRRMTITLEGDADEQLVEHMRQAGSFVDGIDLEILRVERCSDEGVALSVEHHRGYRRVGRGPHSPFTGVADEHRMRAWTALVEAFPRLLADGIPIDMIVDQIAAHNQVAQIHVSAPLLLLAIVTAAHQRLHGADVGEGKASRRAELERLDRDLNLGLRTEDFERYEKLRVELLEAGFFHKPGYETGRPQRDIKFIRDVAHLVVFRLCGYTGPFYGAERFVVRELAASAP
jgi:hypothetical protein